MSYSKNTKERKKKKMESCFCFWTIVTSSRLTFCQANPPAVAATRGFPWIQLTPIHWKMNTSSKEANESTNHCCLGSFFFRSPGLPRVFFFFYRLYCQLYANKAAYSVNRSAHLVFQFLTLWEAGIYHSGCYSYPLENIFLPFAPTQLTSYLKKNKKQNSLKPLIIDKNPLEKRRRSLLSPSPAANP